MRGRPIEIGHLPPFEEIGATDGLKPLSTLLHQGVDDPIHLVRGRGDDEGDLASLVELASAAPEFRDGRWTGQTLDQRCGVARDSGREGLHAHQSAGRSGKEGIGCARDAPRDATDTDEVDGGQNGTHAGPGFTGGVSVKIDACRQDRPGIVADVEIDPCQLRVCSMLHPKHGKQHHRPPASTLRDGDEDRCLGRWIDQCLADPPHPGQELEGREAAGCLQIAPDSLDLVEMPIEATVVAPMR